MSREEFYDKIELLVKMTGGKTNNADNLNAELDEIKDELALKKAAKKALKQTMNDERYFDASSEIIDRNLVIGLKKKIAYLKDEIEANKNTLEEYIKDEETLHTQLFNVETCINDDTNYINGLEQRISKLNKTDLSEEIEHYNTSLTLVKKSLAEEKTLRDEINTKYMAALKGIDEASNLSEQYDNQLIELNAKLEETIKSLEDKDSYTNEELKAIDNAKLDTIEEAIKRLEDRKLLIVNDPVYIASEIKDAIDSDDMISSMNKTKDLINAVSKLPFMDELDEDRLRDTLDSLEKEKDDFVAYIETKKYDEINVDAINDRIVYLNSVVSNINEEIDAYCKRIAKVDSGSNQIATNLEKAMEQKDLLISDIDLYDTILNTEEHIPLRRKNTITSVLKKKNEQLTTINAIIEAYKKEELKALENVNYIENIKLQELKKQIHDIELEKEDLNKTINSLKVKNRDILAEENDKEILKDFNDRIAALNTRLSFDESVSSIREQIDAFFGAEAAINEEALKVEDEEDNTPVVFTPFETEEKVSKDTANDELEFVDFDDNKFLDIPESNVVKIDDILEDPIENFEPLFQNDDKPLEVFSSDDDISFEEVTSFNLPKFEMPAEEDKDLIEVVGVTPIIVEDKKEGE